MKREEFERRKRRLEKQLEEGIELLRAGFRQQLRALELVWMTTADGDEMPVQIAGGTAREAPAPIAASAPRDAPLARPRLQRGQLWDDVDAALERVPRVFDRNDLLKELGYEPDRTSLHRVMAMLHRQGAITLKRRGSGSLPAQYELAEEAGEEPEEVVP